MKKIGPNLNHLKISSAGKLPRLFWSSMRKSAVGIISPSYGIEKVSYGLHPQNYSFHKLFRLPIQRMERNGTFLRNTPIIADHPVQLVHTFNEIPFGSRPFIVSFENELPRYLGYPKKWQIEAGMNMLASDRCKGILAISEIAAARLKRSLSEEGRSEISRKVAVFRGSVYSPPQLALRSVPDSSNGLSLLFVGRDAFGKGLIPLLDAIDFCNKQGVSVRATIVCSFEDRDYISKGRSSDPRTLLKRIQSNCNLIHHEMLPNHEIHRLMRMHDVFVFPTLDESLGWVAVEAAFAGMPVISTDIYALPELVIEGETGFLIKLNKNHRDRWAGLWLNGDEFDQEVDAAFCAIREGLSEHILRFAQSPSLVASMGAAAQRHIEDLYGEDQARSKLEEIYSDALN